MPRYEQPEDLAREDAVAEYLAEKMGCQQKKLGPHDIDRELTLGGQVFSYAEVRTRTNEYRRYPTYIVDWDKLVKGLVKAKPLGVPFLLVVGFTDGVYGWMVDGIEELDVRPGGRSDRGDPNDQDMVAHIPMRRFAKL